MGALFCGTCFLIGIVGLVLWFIGEDDDDNWYL